MVFSIEKTIDISFILLAAIADGILDNDAFKHCVEENKNESWTQLIKDLKFFEDVDEHTMYLRRRSKQNDKLIFGYSDSEWEFIWTTMLEDGAWAVPCIKDSDGNTIKENFAPEILIKYIAHDLK